jgi:hypothetical protein
MLTTWASLILATSVPLATPTTLTGMVRGESGKPIAGANVFISTAAPRQGVGVL